MVVSDILVLSLEKWSEILIAKRLLGCSRFNNAWIALKTACLLSQTERRETESNKLVRIVHRYTRRNPFNIFEKDTRMTCLQLLVWRTKIYGYRAGPFRKNLWKDTHRRRHTVFSLCGWRQWTELWQDVGSRKKSQR